MSAKLGWLTRLTWKLFGRCTDRKVVGEAEIPDKLDWQTDFPNNFKYLAFIYIFYFPFTLRHEGRKTIFATHI
jgi:hypothetical protein